jgi:hypothetical protein
LLRTSCPAVSGPEGLKTAACTLVFVGEEVLSPLPGLAVHRGTEPSAHALGYHLTALRAWDYGLVA